MHRSDINVTELAPRVLSGVSLGTTCACWVCQNNLSTRAVFCQDCGTVQPSRAVDHFTRLGFERRFDLAHSELGGRYDALRRVFLAERAAAKGPRQQQIVSEHLSALEAAYGVLADPARRAEYILRLADYTDSEAANAAVEPYMAEFVDELNSAADAVAIDRVAHKARHGVELALRELAGAFRAQNYEQAAIALARLARLEDIAATARSRRGDL